MERSRTCVKAEACACASACGIYTQPVSKRASREDVMASSLVHTAPIQSILQHAPACYLPDKRAAAMVSLS